MPQNQISENENGNEPEIDRVHGRMYLVRSQSVSRSVWQRKNKRMASSYGGVQVLYIYLLGHLLPIQLSLLFYPPHQISGKAQWENA